MKQAVLRDPVFEAVLRLQIRERGCAVCERRKMTAFGAACGVGKRFPQCRRERGGFKLEETVFHG